MANRLVVLRSTYIRCPIACLLGILRFIVGFKSTREKKKKKKKLSSFNRVTTGHGKAKPYDLLAPAPSQVSPPTAHVST